MPDEILAANFMTIQNHETSWSQLLLDAVFPPRCAGSGAATLAETQNDAKPISGCALWSRELFCPSCAQTLQPISPPFCQLCGAPFRALPSAPIRHAPLCADCREDRYHAAPPFEAARSIFNFEGAVRRAVHRLKYNGKTALAARLAAILHDYLRASSTRFCDMETLTHIVAVPLHPRRERSRGYNQSELLARSLTRFNQIPTVELLFRTRHTVPQIELAARERLQNVRDAFAPNPKHANRIEGAQILLIDDVYTTGATMRECARVLKSSGAQNVYGLTLARAL